MFTSMLAFLKTVSRASKPERVFSDWNTLIIWLQDLTSAFKELFATTLKGIPYTTCVFIEKAAKGRAKLIHKLRYKDGDHDVEEVRTGFIAVEELPDRLKAKLDSSEEVEITDEIESELNLTL